MSLSQRELCLMMSSSVAVLVLVISWHFHYFVAFISDFVKNNNTSGIMTESERLYEHCEAELDRLGQVYRPSKLTVHRNYLAPYARAFCPFKMTNAAVKLVKFGVSFFF